MTPAREKMMRRCFAAPPSADCAMRPIAGKAPRAGATTCGMAFSAPRPGTAAIASYSAIMRGRPLISARTGISALATPRAQRSASCIGA